MSSKSQLIFYDGFILDDKILVASEENKSTQTSKLALIQYGIWSFATFPDKVISVAGLNSEKKGFFLGEGGHILGTGFGTRHLENLPFDDQLGSFLRIRNIDEKIYVCGMSGQVLKREGNKWRKIDRGIRGRLNLDFEDIAGNSEKDLYAVRRPVEIIARLMEIAGVPKRLLLHDVRGA
jgi:hypothetical protein